MQGSIWPKAAVAGGSFWNYNASVGAAELGERLAALVAAMRARGIPACECAGFRAAGPGCTQAAHCGTPYANLNATGDPVQACV